MARSVEVGVSVVLAEDLNTQIENLLLDFFGSQKEIQRIGHLFVIEQEPVQMELIQMGDLEGNNFKWRAETKFRIRPKTMKELEEDSRD